MHGERHWPWYLTRSRNQGRFQNIGNGNYTMSILKKEITTAWNNYRA